MKKWREYEVEIIKDRRGSSQVKIRVVGAPESKHHMIGWTEQVSRSEIEEIPAPLEEKPRAPVFEVRYGRVKKTHKTYHLLEHWTMTTLCGRQVVTSGSEKPEGFLCRKCREARPESQEAAHHG